jgi:hypothetical protein
LLLYKDCPWCPTWRTEGHEIRSGLGRAARCRQRSEPQPNFAHNILTRGVDRAFSSLGNRSSECGVPVEKLAAYPISRLSKSSALCFGSSLTVPQQTCDTVSRISLPIGYVVSENSRLTSGHFVPHPLGSTTSNGHPVKGKCPPLLWRLLPPDETGGLRS